MCSRTDSSRKIDTSSGVGFFDLWRPYDPKPFGISQSPRRFIGRLQQLVQPLQPTTHLVERQNFNSMKAIAVSNK